MKTLLVALALLIPAHAQDTMLKAHDPYARQLYYLCISDNALDQGFCYGYIRAQVTILNTAMQCIPDTVTNIELVATYVKNYPKYIAKEPLLWQAPAWTAIAAIILYSEYGCKL